MDTPKTQAGQLTEAIMRIFWEGIGRVPLETPEYNKVYSHVLDTLTKAFVPQSQAKCACTGGRSATNGICDDCQLSADWATPQAAAIALSHKCDYGMFDVCHVCGAGKPK